MYRGRALDALERAVQGLETEGPRIVRAGLHVRLVDLHDVGAGAEEVPDLFVDRRRVVHRGELAAAAVVLDLRLLRHREGAGHSHLHLAVGVPLEEAQVLDLDGVAAPDRAHDTGHRVRVTAAVEGRTGVVDVDAVEGRWRSGSSSFRGGFRRR
jgi:hypothetical protein